jgi:hypothetical protein
MLASLNVIAMSVLRLNIIVLSDTHMNLIVLSVVRLNVVLPSVVAPKKIEEDREGVTKDEIFRRMKERKKLLK